MLKTDGFQLIRAAKCLKMNLRLILIWFIHVVYALDCNVRSCTKTYRVASGDYLYLISQKISVSLTTLQKCNPEALNSILWVDQILCTACTVSLQTCTCSSKPFITKSSDTWKSIADSQKMTIGYISDCNPSRNIGTNSIVPAGATLCVKCRITGRKFSVSPYYESVVASLNANLGPVSKSGLKAVTFAFITGSGNGTSATPSWEGTALSKYSPVVRAFGGTRTISFGGSEQGLEMAIKFASANGTPSQLAAQYQTIITAYGSNMVFDFDIEGSDIGNTAANTLRSKAMKIVLNSYPSLKVTYTLAVGAFGLTSQGIDLVKNSIANGVVPEAVNIMIMNYGSSSAGIDYDVKAIEATYLQLVSINKNILLGITPMLGKDSSGAVRTISDMDTLLKFATTKPSVYQFGYWAYHRDFPGTVGVSPCLTLAYCAGITGFAQGDYNRTFARFT